MTSLSILSVIMTSCSLLTGVPAVAQEEEPQSGTGATTSTWKPGDFLKIVPQASFAVVVPNPTRLHERAKPIADEVGVGGFLAPGGLIALARGYLNVPGGDDPEGPMMLVSTKPDVGPHDWAIVVAYKDLAKLSSGKVKDDGTIVGFNEFLNRSPMYAMARGRCLWVSEKKEVLEELAALETIHSKLSPVERTEFSNADVFLHFGPDAAKVAEAEEDWLAELTGKNEKFAEALKNLARNLEAIRATLTFDKGVRTQVRVSFKDKPDVRAILTGLLGDGQSDLTGLPSDNLIAGSAVRGSTEGPPELLRWLVNGGIPFWLSNELTEFQISAIGELFRDVSSQIKHTAVAAYRNRDKTKGLLTLAAVITPRKTPDEFVEELRSLSTFVSARVARDLRIGKVAIDYEQIAPLIEKLASDEYDEWNPAITKLKLIGQPALEALDEAVNVENSNLAERAKRTARMIRSEIRRQTASNNGKMLAGMKPQFLFRRNSKKPKRPVIEVLLEPSEATEAINKRLTPLFGSEWKRLRFAVLDEHVVVLFGSNLELLDTIVESVNAGDLTLTDHASVTAFRQFVGEQRLAEWHFSAAKVAAISTSRAISDEDSGELSSLSLSRKPAELRGDFFIPTQELKAWYKTIRSQ